MRELTDSLRKKSDTFMEEGRSTLLDISDTANKMSAKFGGQSAAPAPRPPRRPSPAPR